MTSPVTSASFADVINPVFREVTQRRYDKAQSRIPDFFSVKSSDRPTEQYSELTPMGKFDTFSGAIQYDGPDQGYDVTATHIEYAKGLQIQRKIYDDDQHGVIADLFELFADSAFKTHEDHAAELFNYAFSASSNFFSHTEAVALCSNSHTTPRAGVSTSTGFDNLATAALSPTALSAAILQFRQFKDDTGDRYDHSPTRLIIPIDLEDRAKEILQTSQGLDEADSTKNVLEGRLKLVTWYRLTDTNNWFIDNEEESKREFLWFWRVKFETGDKMESFDNYTAKGRAYMRYSHLRRGWRSILGSQVS